MNEKGGRERDEEGKEKEEEERKKIIPWKDSTV